MKRTKQFKIRVSVVEHQAWTEHAKKLFDDSRKVSLMIRMVVNEAIAKTKR